MYDFADLAQLVGLFIFHWLVIGISTIYVFFRSRPKYDWMYFLVVGGTFVSWLITKNECPVSLLEKRIMYPNYTIGQNITEHPSIFLYSQDMYGGVVIALIIGVLMIYNVFIMMRIYRVPLWVQLIVIVTFVSFILKHRIDYILDKRDKR